MHQNNQPHYVNLIARDVKSQHSPKNSNIMLRHARNDIYIYIYISLWIRFNTVNYNIFSKNCNSFYWQIFYSINVISLANKNKNHISVYYYVTYLQGKVTLRSMPFTNVAMSTTVSLLNLTWNGGGSRDMIQCFLQTSSILTSNVDGWVAMSVRDSLCI